MPPPTQDHSGVIIIGFDHFSIIRKGVVIVGDNMESRSTSYYRKLALFDNNEGFALKHEAMIGGRTPFRLSRKTRVLVKGIGEAAIRSPPPTSLLREATLDSFPKVSGHSEGMKVIDGKKDERKEPCEEEWD